MQSILIVGWSEGMPSRNLKKIFSSEIEFENTFDDLLTSNQSS